MLSTYAVLWDMDGVLVDTGEFHFQAWAAALPKFGLHITWEEFSRTFGMNNASMMELILGRPPEAEFLRQVEEAKEVLFRQTIHGRAAALPGVQLWLERLHSWGIRQAVASSAPLGNIEMLVGELGLGRYFEALVSAADLPSKPDPAVFVKAAGLLGFSPQKCVVIEDSLVGLAAARSAGCKCIAVATTLPRQALGGADYIADRLNQLPENIFSVLWNSAG